MRTPVDLLINGKARSVDAAPDTPLLYVLRDDLGLNAAKYGSGSANAAPAPC
jgi:aerobic-type carbon monoxide dehydrogenase small subunit (CoxS/CutS family)